MGRKKKTTEDLNKIKAVIDNAPLIDIKSEEDITKLNQMLETEPRLPIRIKEDNGDISYGVAIPRNTPNPTQYLTSLKEYENSSGNIYEQFKVCKALYIHEGIVGTVLDMLIDLSIPKVKVRNIKNPKLEKAIEYWKKHVNMNNSNITNGVEFVVRNFLKDYYLCGNVFPYTKWKKTYIPSIKNSYKLPMSMVTIDPSVIEIPPESVAFGDKEIYLNMDRIFGPMTTRNQRSGFLSKYPLKIRRQAKDGNRIPLDPKEVTHLKRKGSSYAPWGVPYLTRVFNSIASKRKLRHLDDSTIDGLINSITIFKVGDKDVPATYAPSRLRAFASLIKNPNPSLTLVWSWDVEILSVSPKGEVLDMTDRYKSVDMDTLYALGMPVSLLTGEGARAGDVWASIIFFVERLAEANSEIEVFFTQKIEEICVENGFDSEHDIVVNAVRPKVNKDFVRNVVLALYDRGLLDPSMTLDEAGYDIVEVMQRREEEDKKKYHEAIQIPSLPFSTPKGVPAPTDKTPKDNQKKDTKTVEVDQTPTKIAPKVEGNLKDRIEVLVERILAKSNDLDTFKSELCSISSVVDYLPNLKIDSTSLRNFSRELEDISSEDESYREKIFNKINLLFGR